MNKKTLIGLSIAFFIPLIIFLVMRSLPTAQLPSRVFYDSVQQKVVNGKMQTDTVWDRVSDFELTNQLGQKVSWKDLEGKIVVASFFFTRCPTICPKMTLNMKKLQDAIRSSEKVGNREANFIHFISFSIDPERDSVDALKKWADRWQINPQNWWLLTGEKKKIYDIALKEFRMMIIDSMNANEEFYHPDFFMLLDKDRVIRTRKDSLGNPRFYRGQDTLEVKKLAEDIVLLSLEKDPKRAKFYEGKLEVIAVVMAAAIIGFILIVTYMKKTNKKYEPQSPKERSESA